MSCRYLFFCFLLVLTGCSNPTRKSRLADFVNDSGNKIIQKVSVADITVVSRLMIDNLLNNYKKSEDENYLYFNIKINQIEDSKPSTEKSLYLNFDMQNDFSLLTGGLTIAPAICQKIQNGVSGCHEYIVAFELGDRAQILNGFTLRYDDTMFGVGNVAFDYTKKQILNIQRI